MLTRAIGISVIAAIAAAASLPGQGPSLATVMGRVGGYTTTVRQQLSNIVADERYVHEALDIARGELPPRARVAA